MAGLRNLLRCIGEAVCARGLRALVGAVPFGDAICEIAGDALQRLRQEQRQEEDRHCLQQAAQAAIEEVKQEARAVVRQIAAQCDPRIQAQLSAYLVQVPSLVRQIFKRPGDQQGRTAPASLALVREIDLMPFLPSRMPRFQQGEQVPGVGDWVLEELLGIGGFGEVWKARHCYFDGIPPVALKFCLDPAARDRLLRHEANVLNQVMRHGRHPGIVPLLDACLSTDPPCLKYEYIEGGDLSGLLREWQGVGLAERWQPATEVVRNLAAIIGAAHRLNPPIVHRDLKPANVLLRRKSSADVLNPKSEPGTDMRSNTTPLDFGIRISDLEPKVTDFGIGSVAALPAISQARQGTTTRGDLLVTALRGSHTPLYASPQQMRGEPPDVRDDVHALGVIWYQMLIGDLTTGAPAGLWAEELEDAGIGRELIRLLGACVSPRADRRPKDAAVLAEQLTTLLEAPAPESPRPTPAEKPQFAPVAPAEDPLRALLRSVEANPYAWLLDLTNKNLGDEGVIALAEMPALSRLSVLYLSGNQIGDRGAAALANSPHLANLSRLILWDNRIGDEGVMALASSPHLANLTHLDLGRNRVGDAGVIALANSPHVESLSALILVSNLIGDAGARALAESTYLANLAELKPLNNRITSVGVTALRERFGKRVRIY